ncbi:MAG: type II secretion system protein GspI [Gammaproteobacteria bacterium]|nr:MAG: type II secretion system protein GspI [Gammaproteobacteria bacterium]
MPFYKTNNILNHSHLKMGGFTLLEILIALAIFGYAAVGLITQISNYQFAQKNASQKTIAHWVAMNQLAETRLEKKWPNIGVTRGSAIMAGSVDEPKTWYWLQTVSKTTEKELRQVEVEVRFEEKDENPTTRFIGFIANKAIKK